MFAVNRVYILSSTHTRALMPDSEVLLLFIAVQAILLLYVRFVLMDLGRKQASAKNVLVLGQGCDVDAVAGEISLRYKYNVVCLQLYDELSDTDYRKIYCSDQVLICPSLNYLLKERVVNICMEMNKPLIIVPKAFELVFSRSRTDCIGDILVIRSDGLSLSPVNKAVKRVFDIITAIIMGAAMFPVILSAACAIKLFDGGPVLYKQERITEGGKVFTLLKFRTMIVDAEKNTGPVLAKENDCRVTPVGRFLRRTRMDELPQLLNVIKGEMSIVGPRPERPHFGAEICEELPEFKSRLNVKAGITGLAQVYGTYSTTPENKLRFDVLYIKNYSIWLDIIIIFKTIGVVLKKVCCRDAKGISKGTRGCGEYSGIIER